MAGKGVGEILTKGVLKAASHADRVLAMPDNWTMKSNPSFNSAIVATKAFLKFCEEHGAPESKRLRDFLEALEKSDYETTKRLFRSLARVANGTFDWNPPVVFDQETPGYVDVVFVSLYKNWFETVERIVG